MPMRDRHVPHAYRYRSFNLKSLKDFVVVATRLITNHELARLRNFFPGQSPRDRGSCLRLAL